MRSDSGVHPPGPSATTTRRRVLWWLLGAAGLVSASGGALVWRGRTTRTAAIRSMFDVDAAPPGCRPVGSGLGPATGLSDAALQLAERYPWHDLRDLRWLADRDWLCAAAPPRRVRLYPELAECWQLRDQLVVGVAGAPDTDVLDAVLDALQDRWPARSTIEVRGPEAVRLELAVAREERAPFFARRLLDASVVQLESVSTAPFEAIVRDRVPASLAHLFSRPAGDGDGRPVASLYARVFGATGEPPGLGWLRDRLTAVAAGRVAYPHRLWLGDVRRVGDRLVATPTDRYLDLERHRPLFALVDAARPAAHEAAVRLVADHAWLPVGEVEATLLANLLIELFWLGPEDPWQDLGAARAFDAPTRGPMAVAVERARRDATIPIGPIRESDGTVRDLRWPGAWRIASRLGAPLDHQGIGPAQLIVGLVLEAGRWTVPHGRLWDRYFPDRPLDRAAVVCATLDLTDATRATALVADYLLHRMDEAFLGDPAVRWPADLYPFPTDSDRARRLLALSLLRTFKAFPEMLWRFPNPNSYPYWHHALNQDVLVDTLAVVAAVWDLELDLGLAATVVPARAWRRALIDHQGRDDRSDGLQVISLPRGCSGGLGTLVDV